MKLIKTIFIMVALATASLFMYSCTNNSAPSEGANTEKQGKEYTAAYVCPMHCEGSGSEEAGKCPVCGMDYVANESHQNDGHSH